MVHVKKNNARPNMSRSKKRKIGKLFKKHLPFQKQEDWQNVKNSSKKELKALIPSKIGGKLYQRFIKKDNHTKQPKPTILPSKISDRVDHLDHQSVDEFSHNLTTATSSVISFPHENIHKISVYIKFLQHNEEKDDDKTRLTIEELFKTFCDLIPGYKIREDSGKGQMKKETRELLTFERHFLSSYDKFLTTLMERRCEESMRVLGDLLVDFPYFNKSDEIVDFMVDSLSGERWPVAEEVIGRVLAGDELGEITLAVVNAIYSRRKALTKKMISVLIDLRICEEVMAKEERVDTSRMSRRERKENKEYKILEKEMRHTEIAENKERVAQLNRQILDKMFYILFKVIKSEGHLISDALHVLAKFAKYINIELVSDLLERFRQLLGEDCDIGDVDKINVLRAVFEITAGDEVTLSVDQTTFMTSLSLSVFDCVGVSGNVEGVLRCLMTVAGKCANLLSGENVEVIVSRMVTVCLYSPPSVVLAYFDVIRRLLLTGGRRLCTRLLSDEEDVFKFCGDSQSGISWQLSLLRNHHSRDVRSCVEGILSLSKPVPANFIKKDCSAGDLLRMVGEADLARFSRPLKVQKRKWGGFLSEEFESYM